VLTHTRDGGGGGERERERERKKYLVRKREGERNTEREGGGGRDKACAYGWQCECATDIVVVKRAEGSAITGVKTRDELDVPHCTCTVARFQILQLCTYSVVRPTHHVSLNLATVHVQCGTSNSSRVFARSSRESALPTSSPSFEIRESGAKTTGVLHWEAPSTKRCSTERCKRTQCVYAHKRGQHQAVLPHEVRACGLMVPVLLLQ
jgi:hypothetical protein